MASKSKKTHEPSFRILGEDNPKRVARGEDMYGYGEQKKGTTFSLTPTASNKITEVANKVGLSRSEMIEQLFRKHCQALVSLLKKG